MSHYKNDDGALSARTLASLAIVLDCAREHIEDIESGLQDGTYLENENRDLLNKQTAFAIAESLIKNDVTAKVKVAPETSRQNAGEAAELLKQTTDILTEVNATIALLRQISKDPFSLQISQLVDVEIHPTSDGDDRVTIGRNDWGFTTVNYTSEGLVVDVVNADLLPDSVWTGSFPCDELEKSTAEV